MRGDALAHAVFLQFALAVVLRAQLIIDAPDIVRLAMHDHGRAGIGHRIEPDLAFGRPVAAHFDVGDQVAAVEAQAFELEAQRLADRAARAVGRDHPFGLQRVCVVPPLSTSSATPVVRLPDRGDARAPADLHEAGRFAGIDQQALGGVLAHIDEGREAVVLRLAHRQPEDFVRAEIGASLASSRDLFR